MGNRLKAFAAKLGGTYVAATASTASTAVTAALVRANALAPEQIKILNDAGFDINDKGFNWEPRIGCFFTVSDDGSIWYKLVLNPNSRISDINHIAGDIEYLCMAEQLPKVAERFYKRYVILQRALSELATC